MLNQQSILDTTKLITEKDGQLFVTQKDGTQLFLAEVDTFTAQLSQNNVDYQPVGSALVYAVPTGYSVTLTLTEAVVRDDVMIEKFLDDIKQGYVPVFDFQGKLRRRDGQSSRHLTPGDIIKRNWSFRVNAIPEYLEGFRYDVE